MSKLLCFFLLAVFSIHGTAAVLTASIVDIHLHETEVNRNIALQEFQSSEMDNSLMVNYKSSRSSRPRSQDILQSVAGTCSFSLTSGSSMNCFFNLCGGANYTIDACATCTGDLFKGFFPTGESASYGTTYCDGVCLPTVTFTPTYDIGTCYNTQLVTICNSAGGCSGTYVLEMDSYPTLMPSVVPSLNPTLQPSALPSIEPSLTPSHAPTTSMVPTVNTRNPTTMPTATPAPSSTAFPTAVQQTCDFSLTGGSSMNCFFNLCGGANYTIDACATCSGDLYKGFFPMGESASYGTTYCDGVCLPTVTFTPTYGLGTCYNTQLVTICNSVGGCSGTYVLEMDSYPTLLPTVVPTLSPSFSMAPTLTKAPTSAFPTLRPSKSPTVGPTSYLLYHPAEAFSLSGGDSVTTDFNLCGGASYVISACDNCVGTLQQNILNVDDNVYLNTYVIDTICGGSCTDTYTINLSAATGYCRSYQLVTTCGSYDAGGCSGQYAITPSNTVPSPTPTAAPVSDSNSDSTTIIIAVVIPVAVVLLLGMSLAYYFCTPKKGEKIIPVAQVLSVSQDPEMGYQGKGGTVGMVLMNNGMPVTATAPTPYSNNNSPFPQEGGSNYASSKNEESSTAHSIKVVKTHVFLTHDWGIDSAGRSNHDRVKRINAGLKKLGVNTWFDEEKMKGNVRSKMNEGINNTQALIVFVTKRYIKKVDTEDMNDNCFFEFQVGLRRLANSAIPVVMERDMLDKEKWGTGFFSSLMTLRKEIDYTAGKGESLTDGDGKAIDPVAIEQPEDDPELVDRVCKQIYDRLVSLKILGADSVESKATGDDVSESEKAKPSNSEKGEEANPTGNDKSREAGKGPAEGKDGKDETEAVKD